MKDFKDMNFKESICYLPVRIINLFSKLFSMRGVALGATYFVMYKEMLPDAIVAYVWMFVILIVVFGDKALSVLKDIKK